MANILTSLLGWFGWGGGALREQPGEQRAEPGLSLVSGVPAASPDLALQLATVWACAERRATTIASLPFFAYNELGNGRRELARATRLYHLLHESPNARMTPMDFWRALVLNHDLRGNGYARIERDPRSGEAIALWPMPADQVQQHVLEGGAVVYLYRTGNVSHVFDEANVLHLKGLGNGTSGLAKLEFMRATTGEAAQAQTNASKLFGSGGKPTGVLMVDNVLSKEQRERIRAHFAEMADGSASRLYVLEANMKYEQLSLSAEDQQLLETRRFSVEEICRWFDVPPVLVHHSNVTTWGSGIEQIIDGFAKFTVRPMLVSIEQAVRKRVMTSAQRSRMTVEFSLDALLRGNAKDRAQLYASHVQNGTMTRNEVRQLENLPPSLQPGADALTAQTNLAPLEMLGAAQSQPNGGTANAAPQDPAAQ